jgi:predicted MFS family arabinose efflux permease
VRPRSSLRPALSGLCGLLVGVGLARFAYTPLLPALISAHWFSASDAAYLGAANLAGYLAGALSGHSLTRGASPRRVIRSMMVLTAVSLLACVQPTLGFLWFAAWRFASGCTGGVIMVLGAPCILAATAPGRRGVVGGTMFTGVGLGIAASGTLVPWLIDRAGVSGAWAGLSVLAAALTAAAWAGWPESPGVELLTDPAAPVRINTPVLTLLTQYALNAVGLVPHMLFLVDFIARGLSRGLQVGGRYWVAFGAAAMVGPFLSGRLADAVGFRAALRLAFLIQAAGIAVPILTSGAIWLAASSAIAGAFVPGISTLVLGRVHELAQEAAAQRRIWAQATIAWALAQAAAGYGCSYLFGHFSDYGLLFALGTGALLLALAIDLTGGKPQPISR